MTRTTQMILTTADSTEKSGQAFILSLRAVPVAFILVDRRWTILYSSRTAKSLPVMTGKSLWDHLPVGKHSQFYAELCKASLGQQPVQFEEYYEPLKMWIEINAYSDGNNLQIYFKDVTAQKARKSECLKNMDYLDVILDLSTEFVWEFELDSKQISWYGNKLSKLLGYQEDADPIKTWENSVHPKDIAAVKANFGAALQSKETAYTSYYRLKKKDGTYIYVRDRARIIRDEQGQPVKVVGVTGDITAQKLYENALIEAKESFQSLFNNAPLPKWVYDRTTLRFLDVNEAAISHYGYSREEFLQMTLLDIRPKKEHSRLMDTIKYNKPVKDIWTHIKKNGEEILVEISTTALKHFGKDVHLTTINDVTEKHKSDLALKESQQKLSTILESIGDGFFAVDRNWIITYMNGKAEKLVGSSKSRFLGKDFWEVFKDATALKFYTEYQRAMKENIPVRFEEYYPALQAWFEVHAYPTEEGLCIYFANISDQKRQAEEQKESAKKLRQAETDLQHVLEAMTDGFLTLDRNWTIKYATDKIAAMLGVNKEAYIGKNLWDAFPQAVPTKFYSEYHRAFAENTFVSFEEYLPDFNVWFEVNAYPYGDVLAVYIKEVTERKNDKKRLEFIARATSEVIWELDLFSKETIINREKFHAVFGYHLPDREDHYAFWLKNMHPDDAPAVLEKNRLAQEQGLDYYMHEYRFKMADGSWVYVKDRIYTVRDAQNKPVKLIGAIENVTAEKMAEQALQESEQTYKQLFDNASLPKAVYDRETLRFLNVNQAAIEHYGYSREEFLNMTVLDVRPPVDHAQIKEIVSKLPLNTRTNLGVTTHLKKGGERIQVDVSTAVINYRGKICNMAIVQDVTEKLRLHEQLTQEKIERHQGMTKAALDAQEKERSQIGRELHDGINQVLTTAKLYVENIKYFPEQKDAFVDKSVSLLQKSINEIRVLSKALVTPAITDTGFKDALSEMIKCYRELNLFEMDYKIHEGAEKIENEIKLTIYRIIQEQLNNIVKYASASIVKTELLLNGKELLVRVEDNGIGFDPEQKRNGLGLNNIKNRAELFNGKVKVKSAPGKGCKIEVRFPL